MTRNHYCVILAGGVGSRFWPWSRKNFPKQFLDFFGTGESLLQLTYRRYRGMFAPEQIIVVTNASYLDIVTEQLPEVPRENVLLEPCARNTAASIAYAAMHVTGLDPEAGVVIAPSDHIVLRPESFLKRIAFALDEAMKHQCLVTLGIRPTRPETGYGYIQVENTNEQGEYVEPSAGEIYNVKTFTEKPNMHMCKVLVDSGEFFWNSGLFISSAQYIIEVIKHHLTELAERIYAKPEVFGTPDEQAFINEIFPYCPNISFDYGVMEKLDNVKMVLCDVGWADLGTWGAIYSVTDKDQNENATVGNEHQIFNDSSRNLVVMDNDDTMVVLQGINDTIVVKKDNVLMICRRGDEHKLKQVVASVSSIDSKYID